MNLNTIIRKIHKNNNKVYIMESYRNDDKKMVERISERHVESVKYYPNARIIRIEIENEHGNNISYLFPGLCYLNKKKAEKALKKALEYKSE